MFARYLRMALTLEQIGYCERISESAAQYAERLLMTKKNLPNSVSVIAKEMVYECKDHYFVIDPEEERLQIGEEWIMTDTEEVSFAEEIYSHPDLINLFMDFILSKHITNVGSFDHDFFIYRNKK